MTNIVLVHGFNDRSGGATTIDCLAPGLRKRGYHVDTDQADYGWHGLIQVRFFHRKAVERIAHALADADVIIDHSNGRNYSDKAIVLAAEAQPEKSWHVISFSGARNSKAPIHPNISRIDVFYTQNDRVVKVARWLLFHGWGDLGAVGYKGKADSRVYGHEFTNRVVEHSSWFYGNNTNFFEEQSDAMIQLHLARKTEL